MKNTVFGWIFFLVGFALLGGASWKLHETFSLSSPAQETACPGCPACAVENCPPCPVAEPAAPSVQPTAPPGGTDIVPEDDRPDENAAKPEAPTEPSDAEAVVAPTQVLLVFDAKSQHISRQVIEDIEKMARAHSQSRFMMDIFTGEMENAAANEALGKRRSRVIRKILEDAGIPARRIRYRVTVPRGAEGSGNLTTRQWRKTTVRVVTGGK